MTNALQEAVRVGGFSTVCLVLVLLSSFSESRRVDCCSLPALLMLQQEIVVFNLSHLDHLRISFQAETNKAIGTWMKLRTNGFIHGSTQ